MLLWKIINCVAYVCLLSIYIYIYIVSLFLCFVVNGIGPGNIGQVFALCFSSVGFCCGLNGGLKNIIRRIIKLSSLCVFSGNSCVYCDVMMRNLL